MKSCRASDRDTSKSHATALRYKTDHFFCREAVIHGEPCTIFFDKNVRMFAILPVWYKQEFADRPGRYDHIIDLDWLPGAGPYAHPAPIDETGSTVSAGSATSSGAATSSSTTTSVRTAAWRGPVKDEADATTPTPGIVTAAGTAGSSGTASSSGTATSAGTTARRGPVKEEADLLIPREMLVDEQGPATTGSPQSIERISRPPITWALFMQQEPKGIPQASTGISFTDLSAEAARQWKTLSFEAKARQWKALSDEAKAFFQELAKEADLQHR